MYPHNPAEVIIDYASDWIKANAKSRVGVDRHVVALSWVKPPTGVFKLNVDGSRTRAGAIGAGGTIRNELGDWHSGFMVNIGCGEVLQAEAWGLFYGLQLALSSHISNLIVESDSATLVNLFNSESLELHPLGTIISNCKKMMQDMGNVQLHHIHRERNMVADLLAKNSTSNALGICTLHDPPSCIIEALLDDIVGTSRSRMMNSSMAS